MISVNIATHKPREHNLIALLHSLERQTLKPDAINIGFNGCDPHYTIYNIELPISIFHNAVDLGASGKFAKYAKQSKGVYITLDDDLLLHPDYIKHIGI